MKLKLLKIALLSLSLVSTIFCFSQDIEQTIGGFKKLKNTKPLKVSGGINAGAGWYTIDGAEARRDPFVWTLNANLNFSVYNKIKVPFAINFNNKGVQYEATNPVDRVKETILGIINKTGFSPKYKSVTVHIGERSMSFSPYTYSGVAFYGLGVEWKPPKAIFDIAAFYGRTSRAIKPDTINGQFIKPSYKRKAWGLKLGLGKKKHKIRLIGFYAKDDEFSLDSLNPIYGIKPMENLVFSGKIDSKITPKWKAGGEYVVSALTTDVRTPELVNDNDFSYFNNIDLLYVPKQSTYYNKVLVGYSNYTHRYFKVGFKYRKIDPTFMSLGTTNTNNDVEELTLNGGTKFFKGRLNLNGNFGTQRNNLANVLAMTMRRVIWAANANLNATKKLNLTASISNFNVSTSPSIVQLVDTIRVVQVNSNKTFAAVYNFGTSLKQTIMFNSVFQNIQDIQEHPEDTLVNNTDMMNYVLNYNLTMSSIKTSFMVSMMYMNLLTSEMENTSYGPSIGIKKKLFDKKMNIALTGAYLNSIVNDQTQKTTNFKLTLRYKHNKHHSIKLNNAIIMKNDPPPKAKVIELQGKVAYAFVF